jgi:hypothetical protein
MRPRVERTVAVVAVWLIAFVLIYGIAHADPSHQAGNYNQGLIIGTETVLYRATHNPRYLAQAVHLLELSTPQSNRVAGFGARFRRSLYNRNVAMLLGHKLQRLSCGRVQQLLVVEDGFWNTKNGAFSPTAPSTASNFFYDDNDWVGLNYVKGYEICPARNLLVWAERTMRFLETGWVNGWGGERWHKVEAKAPSTHEAYVTTTATAGAEQLAIGLYQATHKAHYIRWALRAQVWLEKYMLAPNGLYYDHEAILHKQRVIEAPEPLPWTEEKTEAEYGNGVEWFVSNRIAAALTGEPIPAP